MKSYPDLVAEFAEKYGSMSSQFRSDQLHNEHLFLEIFELPEAKALVQEVARLSAENAIIVSEPLTETIEYSHEFNQDWWQEFTKEKE